ncbi:hypothetical protein BIWAKO_06753 [Bosea sp. BIWAKO-01]|nr:hypothetical protein BIWAKO_06753 [Bosea sp. BIWAKO-01]
MLPDIGWVAASACGWSKNILEFVLHPEPALPTRLWDSRTLAHASTRP